MYAIRWLRTPDLGPMISPKWPHSANKIITYMQVLFTPPRNTCPACTDSMEKSLLAKLIVSQMITEFPAFYENPRLITYSNSSPVVPVVSCMKLAHSQTLCFLQTSLNIILPSTTTSHVVSSIQVFRLQFCFQFSSSHASYILSPSHPPWPDHPDILWKVRPVVLLISNSCASGLVISIIFGLHSFHGDVELSTDITCMITPTAPYGNTRTMLLPLALNRPTSDSPLLFLKAQRCEL
jgi:hypothetical protein